MRTAERNFRFSAVAMHGHHDLALVPLVMLTMLDTTLMPHEPLSKCGTFHCDMHGRWTLGGRGVLYHHAPSEYQESTLNTVCSLEIMGGC